jgi:RNA polymerase sigma-70 factor (ECF subfamily)
MPAKTSTNDSPANPPIRVALSPEEELSLLRGLLCDDQRAWRSFYERYSRLMYAAITRVTCRFGSLVCQEDVREIYSNLCLQLLMGNKRRLRSFDPSRGTTLGAWLALLATHSAYDFLRTRRREPRTETLVGVDALSSEQPDAYRICSEQPDAYRICCAREIVREVEALIEDLSLRDQEFIAVYYGQDLDPEQTAQRLGISVNTVYSKKHKIRARIEGML